MLTAATLAADLRALGLGEGIVLVHASLRKVGPVKGEVASVAEALRHVLGPDGTLVVPTGTADNSDTSRVHLARTAGMTDQERERYRQRMPAFDPDTTPSTGMGALAEYVRRAPGAKRSAHPQTSFAALGGAAGQITGGHDPACHFGEASPLARLYDLDARVLLLGVGFESCSAFHLAEYRYTPAPPTREYRCVVQRGWWSYQDVELDDGDFPELGAAFEATGQVGTGQVGRARARLFAVRAAVDFAEGWLAAHR